MMRGTPAVHHDVGISETPVGRAYKRSDAYFKAKEEAARAGYRTASKAEKKRRFGSQRGSSNPAIRKRYKRAATLGLTQDYGSTAYKDALDQIINTPTSLYLTGKAVAKAAGGDTRDIKKLAKEFKEHDPVALVAQGRFKEAAHEAKEHPVGTLLEASGVKALTGRTAGVLARHAPSATVREYASTDRPNLKLYPEEYGGGPEVARRYSKDLINNRLQKAVERRAAKGSRVRKHGKHKGTRRREPVNPHVDQGVRIQPGLPERAGGGGMVAPIGAPPLRPRINRLIDVRVHQQNRVSQARKADAEHVARQAARVPRKLVRGRKARRALPVAIHLTAEGTVRLDRLRRDLRKRLLDLARERKHLADPLRLRLNKSESAQIRELLKLPDDKLVARVIEEHAQKFADSQREVQRRGVRAGTFDESGQAKRFFPHLQTHVRRPKGEERVRGAGHERMPVVESPYERKGVSRAEEAARAKVRTKTGESRSYNQEAARALVRRARRGKPLTRKQAEVVANAERAAEQAIGHSRGLVMPGAPLAEAVARIAAGDVPPMRYGRIGEKQTIKQSDFANYLNNIRRRRPFGTRPLEGRQVAVGRAEVGSRKVPVKERGKARYGVSAAEEAARRRSEDVLETAAKAAQRYSRRHGGRTPFRGQIEGGPTIITQRPGRVRTSARLQAMAPFEPTKERTGTAFAEGSRPVGREAMTRQAVTAEAEVTAAEGFQLLDRELTVAAGKNGKRYGNSYNEALERMRELNLDPETGQLKPGATPLTPVNMAQFQLYGARLRAKQRQGIPRSYADINAMESSALAETLAAALAKNESGRGKWALWPTDAVVRLEQHASIGPRSFGPLHSLTDIFKDIVLTTSAPARWLSSNAYSLSMRMANAGITPVDVARGMKLMRRGKQLKLNAHERLQLEQALAAATGGGLYHASSALSRSFRPRGFDEHIARTVLAAPWRAWKGMVYNIEHYIEELPQIGAMGKEFRRSTGSRAEVKLHAAQLKTATPEQFARAISKVKSGEGYLTPYSAGDYAKMRLFLAPDGKSGAALRGDELVNLFALPGAKYRGTQVLAAMERRGARRLDATSLPGKGLERFYGRHGWEVERAEPWDPKYGPPPKPGSRVVFMRFRPGASRKEDLAMQRSLKSLLRLHDAQIDRFALGLARDRALEARVVKATEDVIGRWGKVSPSMRRAMLLAPFAQWLGAAVRYVFVTLPVHHPIKTAMVAAINNMTEDERKALGLSYFLPRNKQVQDYQMGALPISVGRNKYGPVVRGIRTQTALDFGTAANALQGNIANFILPQFAGPLDAFAGTSFTNENLVYPDWWPDPTLRGLPLPPEAKVKVGLGALLESSAPFGSAFRRIFFEKGRHAEPFSTLLTPQVRKHFDKQNKTYVSDPATTVGGILDWLRPYPEEQRLYDYGTVKSIENAGIAGEVLDKMRESQKKSRSDIPNLRPSSTAAPTPTPSAGVIDLRGDGGSTSKTNPDLIPLR